MLFRSDFNFGPYLKINLVILVCQSYVEGLNKAELEMQTARETGNYDLIKHWEREAAFNGAGPF